MFSLLGRSGRALPVSGACIATRLDMLWSSNLFGRTKHKHFVKCHGILKSKENKQQRMAKKKQNINKTLVLVAVVSALVGAAALWAICKSYPKDHSPEGIVLVADDTVKAPKDLIKFLEKDTRDDCKDYKGTNTVQGVSLVSIYQVVQDKYARVAIGCSVNLDDGFPVIKTQTGWDLISGAAYYVAYTPSRDEPRESTIYPRCSIIDKHKISKQFEPFCLEDHGEETPQLKSSDLREVTYP
jgi:hypothetical protein